MSSVLEPAVRPDEASEGQTVISIPTASPETASPAKSLIKKPKRKGLRRALRFQRTPVSWSRARSGWRGASCVPRCGGCLIAGGNLHARARGACRAAAAKTAIDILNWPTRPAGGPRRENARGAAGISVRARSRNTRSDWRRIHTVLVDNLTGQPRRSGCFTTTKRRIGTRNPWSRRRSRRSCGSAPRASMPSTAFEGRSPP